MAIEVNTLTKQYGSQTAVNGISFSIPKGQVVGFLGPNGAGKSTTMKMLSCFIPPTDGSALVNGYDIRTQRFDVQKSLGYLPEHNPLYLDMYVREYLRFTGSLSGIRKNLKSRVDEIIEITGLTLEMRKKIGQLSKGYRQRVGLAQAMIHDPAVLILDEPTSGLDPNQITEIRNLIRQLGTERTVMLSTHIMQEVEAICDRIIIINRGEIVADDVPSNLRRKSSGKPVLSVRFRDTVSTDIIRKIEGVEKAETSENGLMRITCSDLETARENLFRFAYENKTVISELNEETDSLEDIFRNLTQNRKANS